MRIYRTWVTFRHRPDIQVGHGCVREIREVDPEFGTVI